MRRAANGFIAVRVPRSIRRENHTCHDGRADSRIAWRGRSRPRLERAAFAPSQRTGFGSAVGPLSILLTVGASAIVKCANHKPGNSPIRRLKPQRFITSSRRFPLRVRRSFAVGNLPAPKPADLPVAGRSPRRNTGTTYSLSATPVLNVAKRRPRERACVETTQRIFPGAGRTRGTQERKQRRWFDEVSRPPGAVSRASRNTTVLY